MPFFSDLSILLVDDLANDGQGEWSLNVPLGYKDNEGNDHVVPAGYHTDINSTPRIVYAFRRFGNRAHRACVLHDYLITSKTVTRERADELFLEAMESLGVDEDIAGPMFRAVSAETRNIAARNAQQEIDWHA